MKRDANAEKNGLGTKQIVISGAGWRDAVRVFLRQHTRGEDEKRVPKE